MALIIQVTLTNDDTGEVEKTYVESIGSCTHPWEAAQSIRRFMKRMFAIIYGDGCDEW